MGLINIRKIKILVIALVFVGTSFLASAAETINKFVAVVNDEVITQQDIDQLLAVMYAQYS